MGNACACGSLRLPPLWPPGGGARGGAPLLPHSEGTGGPHASSSSSRSLEPAPASSAQVGRCPEGASTSPTSAVSGSGGGVSREPSDSPKRTIDYSKWDQLSDSEEEKPKQRGDDQDDLRAVVSGFVGRCAPLLNGSYVAAPALTNHGRLVFHRQVEGARVVLYYWDDRDGVHMCGWWFGPAVGSNTVWAFNPGDAVLPPRVGWREPWFCGVSPSAVVELEDFAGVVTQLPRTEHGEVPTALLKEIAAPVVQALRRAGKAFQCVHCSSELQRPVVLPCGHLVCLAHAEEGGRVYRCPWTASCSFQAPTSGGWQVAGFAERLALPWQGASPSAAATGQLQTEWAAYGAARTPLALIKALMALGELRAGAGAAAEAAAAFLVAVELFEEFEGTMSPERWWHEPRELEAGLVPHYQTLRAKGAAWAARAAAEASGSGAPLRDAIIALPEPTVALAAAEPCAEPVAHAARLRQTHDEATLRGAVECPICFGTVFAPVTTPCGHTFCKKCLARTLDWDSGCPLCRGAVGGHIGAHSVSEQLEALLSALWPEASKKQSEEDAAELKDLQDGGWLPIFAPVLAFPMVHCTIHILEPRYKLMVRRVANSGLARFGACLSATGNPELEECGTELLLKGMQVLPDGRSLIETVGKRRFRILQTTMQDGYTCARVEYLQDRESRASLQSIIDLLEAVRSVLALGRWRDSIQPDGRQPLAALLGGGPVADTARELFASENGAEDLVWAILQCISGHFASRCPAFLAMSSAAERVPALAELLQELSRSAEADSERTGPPRERHRHS